MEMTNPVKFLFLKAIMFSLMMSICTAAKVRGWIPLVIQSITKFTGSLQIAACVLLFR